VHVHGGLVPWISDGGPYDWWTPQGVTGPSFLNNQVLRPAEFLANTIPANEAEYYYPNNQSARFVWYHDHAFGITRLNAYAGIASAYVITDWYETLLSKFPFHIPGPLDARTLYLVFQDKIFYTGSNDHDGYPVPGAKSGDLWYAHVYDPDRWTLDKGGKPPATSVIAEFFGDTILVNGSVYPYVEVEQREYRLRMLNACNARFLTPRIVKAKSNKLILHNGKPNPDSAEPLTYTNPTTVAGFVQIGSEGGYLPYPAYLNSPGRPQLLMAPAERTDLIVDFRNVAPGVYLLYNDAPSPNPGGDPINDYYPGADPQLQPTISQPGKGPNTRTLLQIRVKARTGKADPAIWIPPFFTPTDPFLIFQKPGVPAPVPVVNAAGKAQVTLWTTRKVMATVRQLTLNETSDEYGRLIQYLGTNQQTGTDPGSPSVPLFGMKYTDNPTEIASNGTYEIWEIFNLTGDVHPMHFHLVNVQVLNRQNFDASTYNGIPTFTSIPFAPDANELGYKETVRINPNQVTRVLMKVDLAKVPFDVPTSPRIAVPAGATKAHEFVWHCHILEHEEHDMMRPFVVFE
jgi:spore coat protein A